MYASNDTIRMRWNPQLTSEREMPVPGNRLLRRPDVDAAQSATATGVSRGLQEKTCQCEVFPGLGPVVDPPPNSVAATALVLQA